MYFTIKIIRFVLRLFIKVVLFPFKLVWRLVNGQISDDDTLTPGGDIQPETGDDPVDSTGHIDERSSNTGSTAKTGEASTSASDRGNGLSRGNARRNIGWFRTGLFALGGLQTLLGLIAFLGIAGVAFGSQNSAGNIGFLFGFVLVVSITIIPVLIAAALPRFPTVAWFAGMAYVGLAIVSSLFSLPGGLLTIALYLPVGYFGYTGRSALSSAYGSDQAQVTSHKQISPNTAPDRSVADDTTSSASTTESTETSTLSTAGESETTKTAGSVDETAQHGDGTESETSPEESADSTDASASASTAESETATETDRTESATPSSEDEKAPTEGGPVADLQEELTAPTPATRREAVEELAGLARTDDVPEQTVIDALSERLDDDDPSVRAGACEALGSLGASGAKPALKERRIDPDPEVSRAASRAIRNLE